MRNVIMNRLYSLGLQFRQVKIPMAMMKIQCNCAAHICKGMVKNYLMAPPGLPYDPIQSPLGSFRIETGFQLYPAYELVLKVN